MIWLTWRQFRVQALTTLAGLTALAIYLVVLGLQIRHAYDTDVAGCLPDVCERDRERFVETYETAVGGIGALLLGVPRSSGSSGERPWSPANWKRAPIGWSGPRA